MGDEQKKGELIKKALKIVDTLAEYEVGVDADEIMDLIDQAEKLKRDRLWKLN